MKFEVKVGRQFDGIESSESEQSIVVTVVVGEEKKPTPFSLKKFVVGFGLAMTAGAVPASVAYGYATGDYSIFKEFVHSAVKAVPDVLNTFK